jgi:hypothetical protein
MAAGACCNDWFGGPVLSVEGAAYILGPTLSTLSSRYGFQSSLCPKYASASLSRINLAP